MIKPTFVRENIVKTAFLGNNKSVIPNWGINLTLTYSLSYGKKSERGEVDAEKQLNSAIMKTY